jgi:hypothetical protein
MLLRSRLVTSSRAITCSILWRVPSAECLIKVVKRGQAA